MKIFAGLLIAILFASCLKQEDETDSGPKARITIINAGLESEPVTLLLDNLQVNDVPIPYGESSGNSINTYLPARPGLHSTSFQVGSGAPIGNKFFHWEADEYYTVIQYDTVVGTNGSWLILKDEVAPVDTLAKARFINAVAGEQALGLRLIRNPDTVTVSVGDVFIGQSGSFNSSFGTQFKPGTWRMELLAVDSVLESKEITFTENTLYSLVAIGEQFGTGNKQPTVLTVVQAK
ncbi:DUF4397 domain-containing protein [Flavihumibacter solisilvae]|uniref:DUF4397 domain-containing protein n=1 Tax=Flavihumibacter solisilvae TaxID=1349421 RepID=A0A0C1IJC1_9BACT|nr:DUF4397 domain-containing protein [Flavihumibacter solisilvae]KIC94295.1 hypothetical protein OI18_11705 [Flavihumibacter solisilvae]